MRKRILEEEFTSENFIVRAENLKCRLDLEVSGMFGIGTLNSLDFFLLISCLLKGVMV